MTPISQPQGHRFRWTDLGIVLLLALIAAVPLWGPGMINTRGGGDSPFLLQRTMDMAENLRHGAVPARWMAHAAYDLGYPFFNHYAALPYYISGGLTALGLAPLVAIQSTQTLGLVLSGLTMALWARRIHTRRLGVLLSVTAYLFAPFHLVNLYVRGDSLSEFYAFIWYPLILWTLDRLADSRTTGKTFRRVFAAGLAYGALILTHNVSLLIFSPFALLYALLRLRPQRLTVAEGRRALLLIAAPFLLGMVLTAWFWVPALAEVRYGQLGDTFTEGYFHYSRHFRGRNLIQSQPAFDYAVSGQTEEAGAFAMGLVQAGLTLLGGGFLIFRLITRRSAESGADVRPVTAGYLLLGLVIATLMITPLSRPLWAHLPLLETTQFPWRFLSIQALFTAVLTGAIGPMRPKGVGNSARRRVVWGIVTALICAALALTATVDLHPDRLRIEDDVTWDTLLLYETFTGNIGTTIRYEYLPEDVVPRLYISESVVDGLGTVMADEEAAIEAVLVSRTPTSRRWHLDLESGPSRVVFPVNAWPGWRASVDGTQVPVAPLEGSGRLSLILPAGEHDVSLKLGPTPVRTWTTLLSGLAWIAALAAVTYEAGSSPATVEPQASAGRYRLTTALILGVVLSVGLPAAFHGDVERRMAVFDFETMPYPHGGPVDFGPVTLTAVDPIPEAVEPGATVEVPMRFDVDVGSEVTGMMRLVSPAEPRHGVPYRFAAAPFSLACPTTDGGPPTPSDSTCTVSIAPLLKIPEGISRGLTLLQLVLNDRQGELQGRTAEGRTMSTLYVGATRIRQGPPLEENGPIIGQFEELTLHRVDLTQPDPTTVHLAMTWSTAGTPRNWSLSVRLLDVEGRLIAQHDQQPGYGYLPTSLWHAGEQVNDQVFLSVPEGLAPGRYTLKVITYLQATMTGGGDHEIPVELRRPTLYDLRDACCEQTRKGRTLLCQAAGVALIAANRPDAITQGDTLTLSAEWNALEAPTADVSARWALVAADGTRVTEVAGPLAPGSEPTEWPHHTWVAMPVTLPLDPQVEPGDYTLEISLIDGNRTLTTCTLPQELTIEDRPRAFRAPDPPSPQRAQFGEEIQLLGYDLGSENSRGQRGADLELTLWWQALNAPAADYKRFVHVYDPETEAVAVQDDAMPRAWSYPTSWWVDGEVVSETVTLDLSAVSPDRYHIAVGWYDPETMDRLPAYDADGARQPLDRIDLDTITRRR